MTIYRDIRAKVSLTPEELAHEFLGMDGDTQAIFFNEIGKIAQHMLPMQLQWVTDSELINKEGRYAMSVIGNYSEAQND